MTNTTCPQCGHCYTIPDLPPLAWAIMSAPGEVGQQWRGGDPVPLKAFAHVLESNVASVWQAMQMLVDAGYAKALPYGESRNQYAGDPLALPTEVFRSR